MNEELEKIDIIKSRFDITYEEADAALRASDGDVITALTLIEKKQQSDLDLIGMGTEIVSEMQNIISKGPINKLRIKLGNRIITETSITLTAAATIAIALAAILVTKLSIEVDRGGEDNVCEVP